MLSNDGTQSAKRVFVGLLASLVLSAPFAFGSASAQAGCGVSSGDWTSVPAPAFPSGGATLTDLAISASKPSLMYATNGKVVMRSTDEGCSWRESYAPGAATLPVGGGEPGVVKAIETAEAGSSRAYLMIQETVGPAGRPRVLRTDNAGGTWAPADAGLPPTGTPAFLRVAPSDPDTAYLGVAVQGVVELLYGTDDGGTSWTLRSNFGQNAGAAITDLKVDPLSANDVWVSSTSGLYHSTDGGRTYTAIEQFADTSTGPVDVFHAKGAPASILAFTATGGLLSDNGGESWLQIEGRGPVSSVAHGHVVQSRMMSASGKVWVYLPSLFGWVDARAPHSGITGLESARLTAPAFYGFTGSTIEIYKGPIGSDVKIPPATVVLPDVSLLDPGGSLETRPPKLTPGDKVIKIDAGDSKEVPYLLQVPKSRTPLDVYFLVDTSSSQTKFIAGMASALEGIINGLIESGVDVQFGLAEYRNYPHSDPPRVGPPGAPCAGGSAATCYETNFVYKQRVDISTDSGAMDAALEAIRAEGGGHYNAQLGALLHTASAEGEDVEPIGPSHTDIPPGTNAAFRKNALRVAVLVSDEEFTTQQLSGDPTPPDLPSFDEVAAALNAKDIKQVGISLKYRGTAKATAEMQEMARRTDALAPPGGVDCDGDGIGDVAAGAPLVCEVNKETVEEGGSLAPAIVNLVESIRTRTSLELAVAARDEIVQKVTPDVYQSVALQESNELNYLVTFRCPLSLAGKRFPVKLTAKGVAPQVSTTATVVCRSVAQSKKDEDILPFPLERVLGLIPLIPAAPPPPITEIASSTQAQAQSQAQAQAQASMAAQRQNQPQLAFVHAVHAMRQKAQEEYAMSSFQEPQMPSPGVALGGATVLMSLGFGLTLSRQRQRVRVARSRRSRRR